MKKEDKALFGIGDKIKIVNYGSLCWMSKELGKQTSFPKIKGVKDCYDSRPDLIGEIGLVSEVTLTQNQFQYAIVGVSGKSAWYSEDQMEMINKNPNR